MAKIVVVVDTEVKAVSMAIDGVPVPFDCLNLHKDTYVMSDDKKVDIINFSYDQVVKNSQTGMDEIHRYMIYHDNYEEVAGATIVDKAGLKVPLLIIPKDTLENNIAAFIKNRKGKMKRKPENKPY